MQISIANAIQVARRIGAAAAEVITTNLKMWLGFETSSIYGDNQITPDESGNNNVGELLTGKALEFNGTTDSVTFSSFPTPIKSIVFWYKPLSSASFDPVIWFGGSNRAVVKISNDQGTIICTNLSGKVIYVNGVQTESVNFNQWQRVAINFNSKTLVNLAFAAAVTDNLYGHCQLSDIQLYNESLSLDDIAYDYANPQNLLTDREGTLIELSDLRGYWHLSEGAGSIVYDSSGGSNNGTINGATYEPAQRRIPQLGMMNFSIGAVAAGVTLIPNPNNTSQDIEGNSVRDRLNSLNLDGSGYAEVANATSINPTDAITVECWVYWDTSSQLGIVAKWNSFQGYMLFKQSATKFDFYIGSQNKRCDTALSSGWNHIVGTYDKTNMKLYLNGDIDNTLPHTSAMSNSTQPLEIGRYNNSGDSYSERIDDARIYDRALSATEVKNNYNAGLSAHTND